MEKIREQPCWRLELRPIELISMMKIVLESLYAVKSRLAVMVNAAKSTLNTGVVNVDARELARSCNEKVMNSCRRERFYSSLMISSEDGSGIEKCDVETLKIP